MQKNKKTRNVPLVFYQCGFHWFCQILGSIAYFNSCRMKNKNYNTVGTILKYNTVGTILKYNNVGTILKYNTVGTILKYNTVGTVPKYNTVVTIPKSNIRIVERGKSDIPNTQIHDRSLSWIGTGISIKSGGVKLVLWAQSSPRFEMMLSCKCFRHVSKMPPIT